MSKQLCHCCVHITGSVNLLQSDLTPGMLPPECSKREEPWRLAWFSHRCQEMSRLGNLSPPGAWNKGEAVGQSWGCSGGGGGRTCQAVPLEHVEPGGLSTENNCERFCK